METAHLQPDFDPSSARAADLRGYFIEHSVPYASNAKKGELVALYEEHIRPYAATWLRERERARASSAGIEDHRGGAAPMNDEAAAAAPAPKKRGRPPKSASMNNLASIASSKPSAASGRRSSALPTSASTTSLAGPRRTGMRRSASVEIVQDSQDDADDDEERAIEGDSDVPVPVAAVPAPKRRGRPPKKSVVQMEQLQEEEAPMPMEIDGVDDQPVISSRSSVFKPYVAVPPAPASVQRRSSSGILSPGGRSATVEVVIPSRRKTIGGEVLESGQKRKAKAEDSVAESGFSDYNPFQSGDDASPDGEKKKRRRKSSLGTALGGTDESNPTSGGLSSMKRSSTMGPLSSARKSLGGSNATEDAGTPSVSGIKKSASQHTLSAKPKRDFEVVVPPVPSLPSAYTPQAQQRPPVTKLSGSGTGTSSSKAVPPFQRHVASFESMKTPPEDFKLLVQQAEQSAPPSARKSSGRRSDPSSALVMKDAAPSAYVPELSDEAQDALHSLGAEPMLEGYSGYEDHADDDNIVVKSSRSSSPRKVSPPKQQQLQQRGPAPPSLNRIQSSDIAVVSPAKQEAANAIAIRRVKPAVPGAVQLVGLLLPLLTLLGGYASYWAEETRSLGFCDTETISNSAVVARRGRFDHPGVSAVKSPEDGFRVDWPALGKDLIKTITPETCSPCPPHAECADGAVKACKRDYILQPNALAYLFGDGLDPKSSITSILFKPSCRPDTERLVRVAETASQIAKYLRTHRGDIICGGEEKLRRKAAKKDRSGNPEEWAVYGASEDFTKKVIKEVRNPKISESQFDEIFEEALQDLIGHSEVIYGIDADAEPWVAARTAEMPLSCRTRLAAYRAADEHKASLASVLSVLMAALYGRVKLAQKKRISEQVTELVPVALALLQQQDQNHALDPTLHPYSYLAPSQLRDLVLQAEHSPTRRAELWKRVEKIVEGNSNVRAKVEEQYGEDIRVWQWVGGAYYIEEGVDQEEGQDGGDEQPARRRKSYGGLGPRPSLSRPGTPRVNTPGRHITWSKDVKGSPLGTPM